MAAYILRRLLWTVLLLLVITAVTFVIFYVLPSGDPAKLRAGRSPSPETIAAIRHSLGLDKSLPVQYWEYIKKLVLHFDFGNSYVNDQPVKTLMFDRLPNTMFLVFGAAIIWFVAGVFIGIVSAVARGSFWDRFLMGGALVAISAPVYWLGLVALYLFANDIGVWHVFPGAGAYQDAHGFFHKAWTLVMPWLVLSAAFAAIYARLLRSNLLETMSEDYIRTARAKGLREKRVILRHGVRSAITPVITVLGLDIGILMGGAILTETVFNIDGIGRLSYDAIQRGDVSTIQGTTLVLALAVAIMSLVVDVLYAFLDPRVRY
ncbi:MAG TPA: ABC transporter permease [Baekduia sp.]|uniref:ABC transporter permease n=1 Tax=Baekduia sp. TaxID=2600305 RepID=UPI002D7813D6|nr:ABC transporter permease [Baekduia sp.]HET6508730.1 ABC transporter permease [Baekduia sp.]